MAAPAPPPSPPATGSGQQQRRRAPLAVAAAWYLFYFGSLCFLLPFLQVLLRERGGMSDAQVGALSAVKPWVSAPASFLWGALADRLRAHRVVMVLCFVASTAARAALLAGDGFAAYLGLLVVAEALAAPVCVIADAAVVATCSQQQGGSAASYGRVRLFGAVSWGLLSPVAGLVVARVGFGAAFAAFAALAVPAVACAWAMDFSTLGGGGGGDGSSSSSSGSGGGKAAAAVESLELPRLDERRRLLAGDAAAGAPAGACDPAPAAAAVAAADAARRQAGDQMLLPMSPPLPCDGGINAGKTSGGGGDDDAVRVCVRDAGSHQQHHKQQHHKQHHQQQQHQQQRHLQAGAVDGGGDALAPPPPPSFNAKLRALCGDPAVAVFLAQASTFGFGMGAIDSFLFLYLGELPLGSEALMGLTLTVTCAAEIPVFAVLPLLLDARLSVRAALHLVMAAYVLRLSAYAALPAVAAALPSVGAWAVLPAETLHGLCFATAWGAGTVHAKRLAPPGLESTTQGLFQAAFFGVGQGAGALAGGLLKARLGGRAMFAAAAGVVAALWAATAAAEWAVLRSKRAAAAAPTGQARESRHRRSWRSLKYAELASKDSGPDLAALT